MVNLMMETRELYEKVTPDEMVTNGKSWYASYHEHNCVLTNSDFDEKVSRYDYESFEDLQSAMSFIKTYGNHWIPNSVILEDISVPPATTSAGGNDIINEFFKEEKKKKNW